MDYNFEPEEKLYRAVLPIEDMWKSDGTPSSAAFKSIDGCSVDRGNYREDHDAANLMISRGLQGTIVSLTVNDCINVQADVKYLPVAGNEYHSEIHGSHDKVQLTKSQARKLSRVAKIIGV